MAIPRIQSYALPQCCPENKTNWQVDPDKAVLLVHDMQSYFVNFYDVEGELVKKLVKHIDALILAARTANIPVIYTAQPADQKPEDRALLTDFWGSGLTNRDTSILSTIAPKGGDKVYTKWRYSAFKRSSLLDDMKAQGRDQLMICGIYAHIGILSTVLDAFMYDIKAFVVADAIADFSLEEHLQAIGYISSRCGQVALLEDVKASLSVDHEDRNNHRDLVSIPSLKCAVAEILNIEIDEVDPEENLLYLGLDSIRVMTLLEKWRAQGINITLEQLAEGASIRDWHEIMQTRSQLEAVIA